MLHGLNNTAGLYINIEFILFQDFLGPCLRWAVENAPAVWPITI